MQLNKQQIIIFVIHTVFLIFYTVLFVMKQNYEFLIYVAVILAVMGTILFTRNMVIHSAPLLWGLSIWSIIHMSGGGLVFNGVRLYDTILIPIVGDPYFILRYDQFAHIFGFAVATFAMYTILKPLLKDGHRWGALSIVIVMAGLGVGALNEIIEFFSVILLKSTGVGGYMNTALDLVSNAIGAAVALVFILFHEKKRFK